MFVSGHTPGVVGIQLQINTSLQNIYGNNIVEVLFSICTAELLYSKHSDTRWRQSPFFETKNKGTFLYI